MTKSLKNLPGCKAYLILNNDGIVIKWDTLSETNTMPYQKAVQYSHHVLDLCAKSKTHVKDLFDPSDNHVESIRLRTEEYEMIVAQHGNFTVVVIQDEETDTIESMEKLEEILPA